jgi:oligosaccharide repeat unit polymerase
MSLERIIALALGAALIVVAILAVRRADRFSRGPTDVLALFTGIWGAVLVLFALPLIDYTSTSVSAWLMIYGSIAAVIAACLLADRRDRSSGTHERPRSQKELLATLDGTRLRVVWLVSLVLGLIGFVAFAVAVDRVLGWPALFRDPEAVRQVKRDSVNFQSAYGMWKLLTYFNQIAFVIWTVGVRSHAFTGRWRVVGYLGAVSIVPFLLTADRGLLVSLLVWAALLHLIWPARLRWTRLIAYAVVGVLAAAIVATALGNRYGGSIEDHPEVAAQVTESRLSAVAIPYLYVTGNLPTFGQLTQDRLAPRTYGQMSVLPLVKVAHAAGLPGTPPLGTGAFYPIPFESFSNYGWLGTFWLDFGLFGALLLPAMVAYGAARSTAKLSVAPAFWRLWLSSLLLYVLAYSPFANALSTTFTWQYLLLTPVVALTLDPSGAFALRLRLTRIPKSKRVALAGGGVASLLVTGAVGVLALRSLQGRDARPADPMAELEIAVRKIHSVYSEDGRYPEPLALATRLQVNRPAVAFRPLQAYTDPLPPQGVIAVYSTPTDVFLRTKTSDGRVFEIHRTEDFGGLTFGPGTRDE